ncbi:hypothetical protein [Roseibium sp.]|uniref:hypothetical protein n=1 Tax=Roseibium sp. TaxID=1936156 RepID=UPI003A97D19E
MAFPTVRRRAATFIVPALLIGVSTLPAAAFEPTGNTIADAYLDVLESGRAKVVSIGSVETTAQVIALKNIEMETTGLKSGTVAIAITELVNGSLNKDGRLKVDLLTVEGLEATSGKNGTVHVSTAVAENITLPSPAQLKGPTGDVKDDYWQFLFDQLDVQGIRLSGNGASPIDVQQIRLRQSDIQNGVSLKSEVSVAGLNIPADSLGPKGSKQLTDLGYDSLQVSAEVNGAWEPLTGKLNIDNSTVMFKDMGDVSVSLTLGGFTKEIMAKLQAADDATEPEEVLGLLQSLTFEKAELRIDNEGLYSRALETQGEKYGMDSKTMEMQMSLALPLLLGQLQDEAFRTQVNDALAAFIANPRALTLAANPTTIPTFGLLAGAGILAPQSLPGVLGLTVDANLAK